MEEGPVDRIFDAPAHRYTKSLLDSITPASSERRPEPSSEATAVTIRESVQELYAQEADAMADTSTFHARSWQTSI